VSRNGAPPPPLDDVALMQLADGELGEAEAAALEAALEGDPAAQTKLAALAEIGEGVRSHLELEADAVSARLDAMWSKVEAQIQRAPAQAAVPAGRATATAGKEPVPTTDSVPAPRRSARPEPDAGVWQRFTAWFDGSHLLTGALGAAAAAVLLLVLRQPREVIVERMVQGPAPPTVVQTAALEARAPEVEQLEVSGGTGTVFTIPDDEGQGATAIIWVTPDETEVPL
jgi:hypothetical protein